MTVYLLHFDRPISEKHTCQHYIGYAQNLEARIAHHRKGTSKARLLEVAHQRGIGFEVVRTWEGGKDLERKLKNGKNAPSLCPVCRRATEDQKQTQGR
jgi:predicted GIY-YIG superfamily endonuclease